MARAPRIAFLFLGETLLIPHLYPIVPALAALAPEASIDCWVATSVHEALIGGWIDAAGLRARVRLRRAPGFRALPHLTRGENPPLPPKIATLVRLLPRLLAADLIVCAEQTSLWLPRALRFLRRRFVKTSHGVGSMSARDDPRRRAAYRLLVPSAQEKATYLKRGFADEAVVVTGYVKSGFHALATPPRPAREGRQTVVYAPHWQRDRSSWWAWGRAVMAALAGQTAFDVILAPHQRLVETAPDIGAALAGVAGLDHVHVDTGGFAMVDGSYMAAADVYLGDTSSQVVEFLARPRACVFLNPGRIDWRARDDLDFWALGEVVEDLAELLPALGRAAARHGEFVEAQRGYAARQLGETGPVVAANAARAILAALP